MARLPDPRVRLRWVRLIDRFEQSDLTVAQFCQKHHVSPASLYKWRKRLAEQQAVPPEEPAFVPVHVAAERDDLTASVVRLPGGAAIEIDPRNLEALVAVTERLADEQMRRGQAQLQGAAS